MKGKLILFSVLLVVVAAAAIGAKLAWPEAVDDAVGDLATWFRYFSGPIRRQ